MGKSCEPAGVVDATVNAPVFPTCVFQYVRTAEVPSLLQLSAWAALKLTPKGDPADCPMYENGCATTILATGLEAVAEKALHAASVVNTT